VGVDMIAADHVENDPRREQSALDQDEGPRADRRGDPIRHAIAKRWRGLELRHQRRAPFGGPRAQLVDEIVDRVVHSAPPARRRIARLRGRYDATRSNSALKAAPAARGPSACFQTPLATARKSAPARTNGSALPTTMPPMATQGVSMVSCQISRIS